MQEPLRNILEHDPRYTAEAYDFIREALAYAQDVLHMGAPVDPRATADPYFVPPPEAHVTGQQLCEAIRRYALLQFGLMSQVVLGTWGIRCTRDIGEVVFNLIEHGEMKKSDTDCLEDFDDVFSFEDAFRQNFEIEMPSKHG